MVWSSIPLKQLKATPSAQQPASEAVVSDQKRWEDQVEQCAPTLSALPDFLFIIHALCFPASQTQTFKSPGIFLSRSVYYLRDVIAVIMQRVS